MASSTERIVTVDGFRWQITELGDGPPVVLCHGFPGLGYSYRHQMRALAASGYRAIAPPDMPGYGGTDVPPRDIDDYTNERVSDALIGLLDSLGHERAVIVGHDFGAPVAWTVALRHRARVSGLVLLAVPPYAPDRFPLRPSELYASMARKHFLHIHYFQEPGVADRELDADPPRGFLHRLFYALSGATAIWTSGSTPPRTATVTWTCCPKPPHPALVVADGGRVRPLCGGLHPDGIHRRTELVPGVRRQLGTLQESRRSRHRGADAVRSRCARSRPHDEWCAGPRPDARHRPRLARTPSRRGAGHFVQQERPEEVNELLLTFVAGRPGDDDGDSARAGDRSTRGAR